MDSGWTTGSITISNSDIAFPRFRERKKKNGIRITSQINAENRVQINDEDHVHISFQFLWSNAKFKNQVSCIKLDNVDCLVMFPI